MLRARTGKRLWVGGMLVGVWPVSNYGMRIMIMIRRLLISSRLEDGRNRALNSTKGMSRRVEQLLI